MTRDSVTENASLAPVAGVSSCPPGSGAENASLAAGGAASDGLAVSGDAAAARIAAGQRTLLTPAELMACGLSDDAVAYRLRTGRLHVVFRGVYSMGCGVLPPLGLEQAALMALGKAAFVSHRSAAFVWGMLKSAPADVEVSVVGRCCGSREGLRVHRINAIDRGDLRHREELWLSSPARAVLEIAAIGSRDELIEVIDQGLALRRFTPRDLEAVLARNRGRRGVGRLAELVGDESAMSISRSRARRRSCG